MTRERFDDWCEKGTLGLSLTILVFGPLATGAVRPLEFLVLQCLTILAALLWIVRLWLRPKCRLLWPPISWAVLAFVIYGVVSYHRAGIEYVARQELIRVTVYALVFFVLLNNLQRQEHIQLVASTLIFLGMAISVYAIYQFATNSPYVWGFVKPAGYMKRGSGTYICPNHLAGFLEVLVPLALAYALTSRLGHVTRVILGYASAVMLAGIAASLSRGGWLATALALSLFVILLLFRRQYRLPAFLILVLLAAGGAAFYFKSFRTQKRLERMFSLESPLSPVHRLWLWKPAVEMWKDHPWFGVGPGHYDYRFPNYRPPEVQARPGHTHNDYLNTLADWGVIGAGIVIAAWVLLYAGAIKTWKYVNRERNDLGAKAGNRGAFVFGSSIGLLAILFHSATDFNMHIPANAILVISLMALLSTHLRYASERYWASFGTTGRVLATLAVGIGAGWLGIQAIQRGREAYWLQHAGKARLLIEERSAMLKKSGEGAAARPEILIELSRATDRYMSGLRKSVAAEPMNSETTYELGESLRLLSWQGQNGYERLAAEAIEWFQKGTRLNPYDPYNFMRIGMCLDWLGRTNEAAPYIAKASSLDPNNYYVLANVGWHLVQIGDYVAAKARFERSLHLQHAWHNPIAAQYLPVVERKLKEAGASGSQ